MTSIISTNTLTTRTLVTQNNTVPRINLQMRIDALSPSYATDNRYAILSSTVGTLAGSSGSFIVGATNGRVSVPVSGIYTLNAWIYLNTGSWIYFVINGTQNVDELVNYINPIANPRTIASSYNATGVPITSWTGYLSTTDYVYIGFRDGVTTAINPTTVSRGFSITLINQN